MFFKRGFPKNFAKFTGKHLFLERLRWLLLNGIMSNTTRSKSLIKAKSELHQKDNKNLFVKAFREQVSETERQV